MPGLVQKIDNSCDDCNETNTNYQNPLAENGTMPYDSNNVFWSKHRDGVSLDQLEKFWCELTPQARQKLLRVDKQTLFEHARKNMYCSTCNGLLLEGFLEIVMHGKSLQQDATGGHYSGGDASKHNHGDLCTASEGDVLNLSVHPWGGLSTSRDGTLTLLDCYIHSKSLQGLQKVFDGAHERERQRKLLYPDGCGGGGRGWISQGYSRGHGTRETCALHTARLSVDTLIGFWSALGEETQQSLLRMKEEDFTERLMYRFESKRFCRDCRRNVIREFKELKELKRIRREPCCTSWFCAADTAFQYEVSDDTVQADWHQTFLDAFGTYSHFEWAIGTGKGKSDILEFENVGLSGRVQVNGLDLSSLNACYITLQAWKEDVCCTELSVKAHAMQGQQCVHGRLVVGDGYLTISIGENIRRFFEHAEEVEEEEDDDTRDKEGNEFDGECSRPQKHAKSPELAREFLLDAATVIFKEQVEKAFREETVRQNAHSIFVCLALNLLEERVHVACKEIVTLEKQMKLLEEEEKEKREEEERKERRKTKEREKKLRRKERLREKENKEKNCADANIDPMVPEISNELPSCVDERSRDSVSETGEATPADPLFPDIQDEQLLMSYICPNMKNNFEDTLDGEFGNAKDWNTSFPKLKFRKDTQQDLPLNWSNRRKGSAFSENSRKHESRFPTDAFESSSSIKGFNKQLRTKAAKSNTRNDCSKLNEKLQCTSDRIGDRYDSHACGLNNHKEYTSKSESHIMRAVGESKYRLDEMNGRAKNNTNARRTTNAKKVWEPLDSRKRYAKSNSDSDIALNATTKGETSEADQLHVPSGAASSDEMRDISVQTKTKANDVRDLRMSSCRERENKFHSMAKFPKYSEVVAAKDGQLCSMARSPKMTVDSWSNSDNCSSCLSEGASNASSSNLQNLESAYASDSEECIQNSEIRETSHYLESKFTDCRSAVEHQSTTRGKDAKSRGGTYSSPTVTYCQSGRANVSMNAQHQSVLPPMHNQNMHYPVVQAPTLGYYHQSPVSWTAGHTNGLMSYPYSNHYLIANTLGYGLNCNNAQFIQYGPLQHLPAPLLNPVHRVPVLPLVTRTNGISTKEHRTNVADIGLLKEERHSIQKVVHCTEKHSAEENGKSDKADKGNNDGFSLFHFGGPLALSTVFKSDTVSSNEESVGNTYTCANLSDNNGDGNKHPWNKKDSIEEYNLFAAASNGIRFSIF